MAKIVSFKVTDLERAIITVIAHRAVLEGFCTKGNILNLRMDITATHVNGCPLRLADLAVAGQNNFGHDLLGISRYLNRETGQLGGHFHPRFSKPQEIVGYSHE